MSESQTKDRERRAEILKRRRPDTKQEYRRQVAAVQAAKREVAFARLRQQKRDARAALSGETK